MAFDKDLAQRIREIVSKNSGFNEKKMFGGICFLLHGNMACGIIKDDLIVRVGPQNYAEALKKACTRQFDITGKPMKGWVMVSGKWLQSDDELTEWVRRGVNFALSLPSK